MRLFKSIIVFCETGNIMWNIPTLRLNIGIFFIILSIPKNIVIGLNNVMTILKSKLNKEGSTSHNTSYHFNVQ
jgi:hypothetical protein